MATNTHISARGGLRRTLFLLVLAGSVVSIGTPSAAGYVAEGPLNRVTIVSQTRGTGSSPLRPSYGWPLKPFDQPHPVRAYLNDPRISGLSHSFHFGIDIGVPEHKHVPVFAVQSGTARLVNRFAVMVWGARAFGYWHVIPVVRPGQFVHRHQLIGMSMGWNHVHFGEYSHGQWLNPLRPGGLGPYYDSTVPTLQDVSFEHSGQALDPRHLNGAWSLTLSAFDTAASIEPAPWPVAPALLRWRIVRGGRPITSWRTLIDSRTTMPKSLFSTVYAPATAQNHPGIPGQYRFYLVRGGTSRSLPDGSYAVEIRASDTRANSVVGRVAFTIENN